MPRKETLRSFSVLLVFCFFNSAAFSQNLSYIVKRRGSESILEQSHALDPMVPASNAKLVTTRAILSKYPLDHTWETEIFLNNDNEITITFAPDPLFTTEALYTLFDTLKAYRDHPKKIFLDFSHISGGRQKEGVRAFEGEVSPFMFNFNSLELRPSSSSVVSLPFVSHIPVKTSADAQEPMCVRDACLVPKNMNQGAYRSVYSAKDFFLRTFTETSNLFSITKEVQYGVPKQKGVKLFTFRSRPLRDVLYGVLQFSTNSLAEHLMYSLSPHEYSRTEGIRFLNDSLKEISKNPLEMLVDGSGLSGDNRLTAWTLVRCLESLSYSENDFINFVSLLPQGGVSGTLKSRNFGDATHSIRAKTGSLDNVQSLSGFLFTKKGSALIFSILNNNISSKDEATRVETRLLEKWFSEY